MGRSRHCPHSPLFGNSAVGSPSRTTSVSFNSAQHHPSHPHTSPPLHLIYERLFGLFALWIDTCSSKQFLPQRGISAGLRPPCLSQNLAFCPCVYSLEQKASSMVWQGMCNQCRPRREGEEGHVPPHHVFNSCSGCLPPSGCAVQKVVRRAAHWLRSRTL